MLGDDIAAALPELRAQAESLMVDKVAVERRQPGQELDPDTLEYRPVWVPVYAGRGRIQVRNTQTNEVVAGGRQYLVTEAVVQLPIGSGQFGDDDRVVVRECAFDPELVGAVLSVTSRELKTHATMRRLRVSEVIGS